MSRSIHKTIKQLVRENSNADLADPENPDLVEYAKKISYKKEEKMKRQHERLEKKNKQNQSSEVVRQR